MAREFIATPERLQWLWNEMNKYRTLFNDFTRGNPESFEASVLDPYSYWIEIVGKDDQMAGVLFIDGLNTLVTARMHLILLDRNAANKVKICSIIIDHIFRRFIALRRLTIVLPEIYHATIRLVKKLRFVHEGTLRESELIGGRWVNECIYGILAREVLNAEPTAKLRTKESH